ncbi:MAG: hypothetical protein V4558_06740 [Gemmatimonadota bacterium]
MVHFIPLVVALTAAVAPCTATATRSGYAMTWDADHKQVVIFGGEAPGDVLSADTWGWNGTAWTCIAGTTPSGPRPRNAAMLAYDARRHVLVLYGGRLGGREGLRDTWELGPTGWTQRDSLGPTPDPHGVIAWDEASGSVLLYHSKGDDGPGRATWRWSGNEWTKVIDGPDEEFPNALFASTSISPATLITAKRTGTRDSFEAVLYQWQGNRWVLTPATGTVPLFSPQAPAARTASGAILYAGFEPDRTAKSWVLEGVQWRSVSGAQPPRRKGAQMVFDPVRRVAILHAGDDGQQLLSDTWEWNGSAWRQVR